MTTINNITKSKTTDIEPNLPPHQIEEKVIQKMQQKVPLVGGENSENVEIRERKKRRKKHADDQKKKIRQLANEVSIFKAVRFFIKYFNTKEQLYFL